MSDSTSLAVGWGVVVAIMLTALLLLLFGCATQSNMGESDPRDPWPEPSQLIP